MKKQILSLTLALCASFVFSHQAKAQSSTNETSMAWRRGTAIVLFAGIGGGILGLSTLSFYGQPQEHTENITLGGLAGVIAGLGYVSYKASNPATRGASDYSFLKNQNRGARAPSDVRPIFNLAFEF